MFVTALMRIAQLCLTVRMQSATADIHEVVKCHFQLSQENAAELLFRIQDDIRQTICPVKCLSE